MRTFFYTIKQAFLQFGRNFNMGLASIFAITAMLLILSVFFIAALNVNMAAEGIKAEVLDIHTLKPIDSELIVESAKKTGAVVTFEEDSIFGGLFGAVTEVLAKEYPVPADGIGATDYAESGDYEKLLAKYGYTAENLAAKAKEVMARK